MKEAPLHPQESARIEALNAFDVLDTEDEKAFDELTELASAICGTPISLISLVDTNRQWFKSKVGLEAPETPRSIAFCSHAILQEQVFEVPNAIDDDRFSDNPLVTDNPDIRFYAGAPLVTDSGLPIGTLCVIDQKPKVLTEDQKRALQILAKQVIGQLELRLHAKEMDKMNANRDKMFAVIAHDLRSPFNGIMGMSRLLSEQAVKLDPSMVADFSKDILKASMRLFQTLDELLQWSQNTLRSIRVKHKKVKLGDTIDEVKSLLKDAIELKDIKFSADYDPEVIVETDQTILKTILRNLITNAIKFTPEESEVKLGFDIQNNKLHGYVQDSGEGFPAYLLDQVFTSEVESLVGTQNEQGHGLGLLLCGDFIRSLNGDIHVDKDYKDGAKIHFYIPLKA